MRRIATGTKLIVEQGFRRYPGWILLVSVSIVAVACVPSEPRSTLRPYPSFATSESIQLQTPYPPTATEAKLPTPMPTTTPTPAAPSVRLDELAPGQYIAFDKIDTLDADNWGLLGLHLVSIDGIYQGRLAFLGRGGEPALMPDGQRLILSLDGALQAMDLMDHSLAPIPASQDCYGPSLSPDGSALAAQCYDAETNIPDIYVLYPDRGTRVLLTNWRGPLNFDDFTSPQWSPDGKWIAFQNLIASDEPRPIPREGLYLSNTDCLSDLSTCQAATHGPIACYHKFTWSPDSEMLACLDPDPIGTWIRIFRLDGRVVRTLHADDQVEELAWSPDGRWIAVSMENRPDEHCLNVYIISVDGEEVLRLTREPHKDQYVRFWVAVL
jgi:dipeptidyl aminopeptidase/acylaminoacyl peptidase